MSVGGTTPAFRGSDGVWHPVVPNTIHDGVMDLEELPEFDEAADKAALDKVRADLKARRIPDLLLVLVEKVDAMLSVQQQLLERMGESSDSRSSVEIATNSKGTNITAKAYSGSAIEPAESAALESYLRLTERLDGVKA